MKSISVNGMEMENSQRRRKIKGMEIQTIDRAEYRSIKRNVLVAKEQ